MTILYIPTETVNDIIKAHDAWMFGELETLAVKRSSLVWKPLPKRRRRPRGKVVKGSEHLNLSNAGRVSRRSKRRDAVLAYVIQHPDCTAHETMEHCNANGHKSVISTYLKDLRTLAADGAVRMTQGAPRVAGRYKAMPPDYRSLKNTERAKLKNARHEALRGYIKNVGNCTATEALAWWNAQEQRNIKHVRTMRLDLQALRDAGYIEISDTKPADYRWKL